MLHPLLLLPTFLSTLTSAALVPHHDLSTHPLFKRDRPPSTNLPPTWRYLGCYTDQAHPRTLRALTEDGITLTNGAYATLYGTLTGASCIDFCRTQGYSFAATQYMYECFCASTLQSPGVPSPDDTCNMPCDGNASEACGGPYRLTVYTNDEPYVFPQPPETASLPDGWAHEGCYTDAENAEGTLRNGYFFRSDPADMSAGRCVGICAERGYVVAGTKGQECYCAGEISAPGTRAERCVLPCPGLEGEACGGRGKISVYVRREVVSSVVDAVTSTALVASSTTAMLESTPVTTVEGTTLTVEGTTSTVEDTTTTVEDPTSTPEPTLSTPESEPGTSEPASTPAPELPTPIYPLNSTTIDASSSQPTFPPLPTPSPPLPNNATGAIDYQCLLNSISQCMLPS